MGETVGGSVRGSMLDGGSAPEEDEFVESPVHALQFGGAGHGIDASSIGIGSVDNTGAVRTGDVQHPHHVLCCVTRKRTVEEAYTNGCDDGYELGRAEGYEAGQAEGYESGRAEGYKRYLVGVDDGQAMGLERARVLAKRAYKTQNDMAQKLVGNCGVCYSTRFIPYRCKCSAGLCEVCLANLKHPYDSVISMDADPSRFPDTAVCPFCRKKIGKAVIPSHIEFATRRCCHNNCDFVVSVPVRIEVEDLTRLGESWINHPMLDKAIEDHAKSCPYQEIRMCDKITHHNFWKHARTCQDCMQGRLHHMSRTISRLNVKNMQLESEWTDLEQMSRAQIENAQKTIEDLQETIRLMQEQTSEKLLDKIKKRLTMTKSMLSSGWSRDTVVRHLRDWLDHPNIRDIEQFELDLMSQQRDMRLVYWFKFRLNAIRMALMVGEPLDKVIGRIEKYLQLPQTTPLLSIEYGGDDSASDTGTEEPSEDPSEDPSDDSSSSDATD